MNTIRTIDMERYHVRVAKDDLTFSAAHFITFDDGTCEPLHGHNYRVAVEVHGPLNEAGYVTDFVALTDTLRTILAEWDHRILLPTTHPKIHVRADHDEVRVTCDQRRWVFPRADCVLLELANTTAELLARHVARRLLDDLDDERTARPPSCPKTVRIELEESSGHSAVCELTDA